MFKLVVLTAVLSVALARPNPHHAVIAAPAVVGSLVSEKTIESHGNTVIHGSAPVLQATGPAIAYAATPILSTIHATVPQAHVNSQKTIESHGNSVVHGTAPVVSYAAAIPAVTYAAASVPVAESALISEKSVYSYGQSIVHQGAPVIHVVAGPALAYSTTYAHPAVSVW